RDFHVTGVQTCALPIWPPASLDPGTLIQFLVHCAGLPVRPPQTVGDPRMARIAGVNLPAQKHVWVGLQSIYGIGRTRSKLVCDAAGVASNTKIRDRKSTRLNSSH